MRASLGLALLVLTVPALSACRGTFDARTTMSISGTITGAVSSGVPVHLSGSATANTTTDSVGHYSFGGLAEGSYTIAPTLNTYSFAPLSMVVLLEAADVTARDFVSNGVSVSGWINGTTVEGVTIEMIGPVARSTTTDALGGFTFELVPDGAYTVTPSSPSWSFVPSQYVVAVDGASVGMHFLSTPPSSPFSIAIAGDAASGVAAGLYPGNNNSDPNPDVVVYDPAADMWTIRMSFDTSTTWNLGGFVSFRGTPLAGTYTESSVGLTNRYGLCWTAASVPASFNQDELWTGSSFSLTLSSIGAAVPTNLTGVSTHYYLSDYPVHGTFHAVCTPNSIAQGTVTVDVTF